mmetsp:Transcript_21697/g.43749  ORF Transcript_21697/g.43749 Transcript_21697/m.43749 type:complete len:221 (-) Transcript_21697:192-854(-)
MFGCRKFERAVSVEDKRLGLMHIGHELQVRSYGAIDGTSFAKDFNDTHHIVERIIRVRSVLRKMCKVNAVEAAEAPIRATTGSDIVSPGAAMELMTNACEKLLHFNDMQTIELICIQNAFQCSDPAEFDTTNADLSVVYTFISQLIEYKTMIHGQNVIQVNSLGYDAADLQNILNEDDEFEAYESFDSDDDEEEDEYDGEDDQEGMFEDEVCYSNVVPGA